MTPNTFVQHNVHLNLSMLMSYIQTHEESPEGADTVTTMLIDIEATLEEAGFTLEDGEWTHVDEHPLTDPVSADDLQRMLDESAFYYETAYREVFEHWAVSEHFMRMMIPLGESFTEAYGLIIWNRTTTGQAISMDHCVQTYINNLNKET